MPNVMGREFPYTSEGMAAAEQYSQALGMRDGGMMGFRPIAMADAGDVEAKAIARGFYDLMKTLPEETFLQYINENRTELEGIAQLPDKVFNTLREVLRRNPMKGSQQSSPSDFLGAPEDVGNLGRAFGDTGTSDYNASEGDLEGAVESSRIMGPEVAYPFGFAVSEAQANQDYGQADPGMNFGPVAMNRGGIMSLRGY